MTTGSAAADLIVLFAAAFGAATILPFQSEIVFGAMQAEGAVALWLVVAVASVGNTLGSVVNYLMGLWAERFRDRRWFPATPAQLDRAQRWYARWGVWSLLLSWAPFADALTVAAGVMRTPWWLFLVLVSAAKTGRYLILAGLLSGVLPGPEGTPVAPGREASPKGQPAQIASAEVAPLGPRPTNPRTSPSRH